MRVLMYVLCVYNRICMKIYLYARIHVQMSCGTYAYVRMYERVYAYAYAVVFVRIHVRHDMCVRVCLRSDMAACSYLEMHACLMCCVFCGGLVHVSLLTGLSLPGSAAFFRGSSGMPKCPS